MGIPKQLRVLLFHGLTSQPSEMEPLATLLRSHGYLCNVPLLPGHGYTLEKLRRTRTAEWISAAHSAVENLLRECHLGENPPPTAHSKNDNRKIVVIGESFGAVLALFLARSHASSLAALILLSPSLHLRNTLRRTILTYGSYLPDFVLDRLPYKQKRERNYEHFVHPHRSFPAYPLGAVCRMQQLVPSARALIAELPCPTLLLYDPTDHLLDLERGLLLSSFQRSHHATLHAVLGGEHELLLGPHGHEVENSILSFVERYA